MATVPDDLKAVFTSSVKQDDGFHLDIPLDFIETGTVEPGKQYRVALIEAPDMTGEGQASTGDRGHDRPSHTERQPRQQQSRSGPPVEQGETLEVQIESLGDAGDGVAKVDGGYVVIVPDTSPGQQPVVRVTDVKPNVAFATVVQE